MLENPKHPSDEALTHVTVLVLSGATMMTLASVVDPLRAANRLLDPKLFEFQIVSPTGEPVWLNGGINLPVSGQVDASTSGDYLIVIASYDWADQITNAFTKQLAQVARRFQYVCGVEAGTWLLARCGLLKDCRATTHWEDLENLQQKYPDIDVCADRFVAEGKIWTCGGASPAFDMLLHITEKEHSRSLALDVASLFIYDRIHLADDQQPNTSLGRLERREPRLADAIREMEKRIDAPITIAAIADRLKISLRQLEGLFRLHLDQSPGAYFLQMRLQSARKLIRDTSLSMQEISIRTGFSDQSSFSRSFKSRYGISPVALRKSI